MSIPDMLSQHLLERPLALNMIKDKGVKIVAYSTGDYVPDELIHAAGAVPISQIHGGDPDSVEAAHSVKELKVQGIVWYQLKMCESYNIESIYFARHLKEHNLLC